jgi:hypothetical protein
MSDAEQNICQTVQIEVERVIKTELVDLKKEVDTLYKTVYQGNGNPSLVSQLSKLDTKQADLTENIERQFKSMCNEQELKFDRVHEKLDSNFGRLEAWMNGLGRDTDKDISHISQSIRDLGKEIDDYKRAETAGKWQVKASALTALAGIITAAVAVLFNI